MFSHNEKTFYTDMKLSFSFSQNEYKSTTLDTIKEIFQKVYNDLIHSYECLLFTNIIFHL